ncbi:DEDD exonuclease domain-containing protein [Cellulosimicrobium arenosum]|uniref:DEDD exonuclease domain-containing protein n=1 Tax=Cellulosimicrobium arenosum TaxID=2708133 RepID=A0A927IWB4_9MICO|nr:DEDD exonuclease domain-containing protein [Cellulosimicrobium arenosum]MBD8077571.1 DEDD exonuclease domain-containing protein [Cellulosimicrobium arenosum]
MSLGPLLAPGTARVPGTPAAAVAGIPVQPTLDDLGTPLQDVTFVVVDLETTGGSSADCGITEIGAVKVRGGEVLGEFQTLVDPGHLVPAFVARLTGITSSMVSTAPRIEAVLPSFLEFVHGAVLVAHNAPFDVSFLKAACRTAGYDWPGNQVLDTVPLARRVVTRDEAPNHKLSTLAALFRATVTPEHRALADARATVDVLHALLARLGPLGVTHLEDLAGATDPVPQDVRRKRHLADGLPDSPGVYLFRGPGDEVLYVGTSTSIRRRVRSYFTRSEKRGRITEMVRVAHAVTPVVCATPFEAQVRELRLIAEHSPRYNRRSRNPERMPWVRLTREPYPRLSVVRDVQAAATHIGPFASRQQALAAVDALHDAFPVRQCTRRLPLVAGVGSSACVLHEMGRCSAPCTAPVVDVDYSVVVEALRAALEADPAPVVSALGERIAELARDERFEQAGEVTHRLRAFLAGAARAQRTGALAACREVVAARATRSGGWEIVVVRHARLAATGVSPPGADPLPLVAALVATAEAVEPPVPPSPACHPHEAELVLSWLESPGVRLVELDGTWACPVRSARSHVDLAAAVGPVVRSVASTAVHGARYGSDAQDVVVEWSPDDDPRPEEPCSPPSS